MKMTQKLGGKLLQTNEHPKCQKEKFLCINPDCKVSGLKYFEQPQLQFHEECTGWIIRTSDIEKIMTQQSFQSIDINVQNTFDFKFSPLKSLFEIGSVFQPPKYDQQNLGTQSLQTFSNPIQLLKINFELIKTKIQNELARVFYEISDRIQKIKQIQMMTSFQIKSILSQNDVQKISQSIKQSTKLKKYKEFTKAADLFTLIHEQKVTKEIFKIFESIQNIGKSFWNTQLDSFKRQKEIIENAKKNIENFNKDETVHPHSKLQNLANLFQVKNVQPFVPEDKMSAFVRCWICQKDCYGKGIRIKQHKAEACQSLINHIMSAHQQQIMSKFICQIMKTAVHKISYEELFAEIQEKNYSEYIIIDRQNSNKGVEEFINNKISDKTFILNVLSSQNQKIAAGKYILANSTAKDSADTLMIMIIYAIVTSGFYRFTRHFYPDKKPKITLLTKDHFAGTLKDILKNDFDVEIQIVK